MIRGATLREESVAKLYQHQELLVLRKLVFCRRDLSALRNSVVCAPAYDLIGNRMYTLHSL